MTVTLVVAEITGKLMSVWVNLRQWDTLSRVTASFEVFAMMICNMPLGCCVNLNVDSLYTVFTLRKYS